MLKKIVWEVRGCEDFLYEGELHTQEVPDDVADYFGLYTQEGDGTMQWFFDFPTREDAEEVGRKLEKDFSK